MYGKSKPADEYPIPGGPSLGKKKKSSKQEPIHLRKPGFKHNVAVTGRYESENGERVGRQCDE